MFKKLNSIVSVLIVLFIFNCAEKGKPNNFDYGSVDNYVYTNNFFKCQLQLPNNWVIQSQEKTEEIANQGKNLVAGNNKQLEAIIEASEINTANLLAVYQYELGAAVEYNPNIMLIAENVKSAPGIKNGSDYLYQSKRFLEQGQFKYDYLSEDFKKEMINGTEFYKMDANLNYMGINIKQMFYSTISNGFSFNVIVSYVNEEQKTVLLKSLNSLTFKK